MKQNVGQNIAKEILAVQGVPKRYAVTASGLQQMDQQIGGQFLFGSGSAKTLKPKCRMQVTQPKDGVLRFRRAFV